MSLRANMIEAQLKEIGPSSANMCGVPSKDELLQASPDEPLGWYPVGSYSKSQLQSE